VRAFESDEVVHVDDSVDPIRDLETIQSELCKKDTSYGKLYHSLQISFQVFLLHSS
jgi:ribosome-binding ATPase YchF (GTP1/OBG family)